MAVLVVAKAIMVAGHHVPLSAWTPFVYLWQDVLLALAFGVAGRLVRRPAIVWTAYALLTAYVAINVPVARELSSPLTLTMMRGARGPLADSIGHVLTVVNLAGVAPLARRPAGRSSGSSWARWRPRASTRWVATETPSGHSFRRPPRRWRQDPTWPTGG
jgi:hypothetical protein